MKESKKDLIIQTKKKKQQQVRCKRTDVDLFENHQGHHGS